MKDSIHKLFEISKKTERKILGLMSGTSLDGLDIALCNISGNGIETELQLLQFITIPYNQSFKENIQSIFSKKNIETEQLCLVNELIGTTHAQFINETLLNWGIKNNEIDLIASHGQTIYHAPFSFHQNTSFNNGSLQIGDGDHIAVNTNIITLCDFRQKHIAAGGEGAPLATYGDYLLFSDQHKDRILLNIGGISNLTHLPSNSDFENITATDIGPGNTLMNVWAKKHFGNLEFDQDGTIASKGSLNHNLLNQFLKHPFFNQPFPKTTGPEIFNLDFIERNIQSLFEKNITLEDVMATLNELTAFSICKAIEFYTKNKKEVEIVISGGGIHNSLLISKIKSYFKAHKVCTSAEMGINPDAKEAILFAILANECISGNKKTFVSNNKNMPNISMGKICLPE